MSFIPVIDFNGSGSGIAVSEKAHYRGYYNFRDLLKCANEEKINGIAISQSGTTLRFVSLVFVDGEPEFITLSDNRGIIQEGSLISVLDRIHNYDLFSVEKDELQNQIGHLGMLIQKQMHTVKETNDDLRREIQDLKEIEKRLTIREKKYRDIVENANSVILKLDKKGKITFFNKYAQKFFGFGEKEILGCDILGTIVPETEMHRRNVQMLLDDTDGEPLLHENVTKDGEPVWIAWTNGTLTDGKGEVLEFICIGNDQSEQRKIREHLERSEEKFRILAEQSPNMIFIDQNGRIVYANARCEIITGYTREELCSPDFRFKYLLSPEFREAAGSKQVFDSQGERTRQIECALIARNGGRIEASIASNLIDYEGTPSILAVVTDITELKAAEEKIRESDNYYRTIFETTGTATMIVDDGGRIALANEESEGLFGYSRKDLEGKIIWEVLFSGKDRAQIQSYRNTLHRYPGENPRKYETQISDSSGTQRDVLLTVSAIPGTMSSVLSITDITDRKQAERALRESEECYRSIFEMAKIGIVIVQDGMIRYANPWTIEFLGQTRDRILSLPFTEFIIPDDQERVLDYHWRRLAGEALPEMCTFRINGPDGEERWVALNVVLFTWEGRPATLNFIIDIDEQVRTKKALMESELRYRTTIDSICDLFHVIDRNFRILLVNRAFRDFSEKSGFGGKTAGNTLQEAFPILSESTIAEYNHVFRTGEPVLSEEHHTIAGVECYWEVRKIPVFEQGAVDRIVTVIRDLSAERHIDVLKKEAFEQIEKNMEQFAILNDNIRNPLQAIVGIADLEGGEMADKIYQQALEIDDIIKKLDMGWMESAKIRDFIKKHYT